MKNNDDNINNAILNFFNAPHLRLNKNIIDTYGIDVALWIADIFSRWNYFRKEGKLEDGYFFITQDKIRESTKLNFSKQTNIIKLLTKEKIIKVQRKGIPAKNWYKINTMVLISKIEDSRSKFLEIEGTGSVKSKDIYNKDSLQESFNNFNKNNIYTLFLEKWNEQKIILHKKITSKKESSIKKALKDFTQEEIFKSFQNYATVLHSPDYFWNYTWTMEDFLQRGLHRFVDEAIPLIAFKNNFSPDSDDIPLSETKLSPAGFPLITHSYDRTAKKRKTVEEWQLILERYTNKILSANIWEQNYTPDKITVFNGVVSMQKWLDNIDYDCLSPAAGGSLEYRIYPLNKLIDYYILCIDDWWSWMDKVKDSAIHVNSKIFKMFIHELENSFAVKIDIKSKGWENDSDWTPGN